MPEMPEVEAFKKYIGDTSLHKKIVDVETNAKSAIKNVSFNDFKKLLKGNSFSSVKRMGKYLVIPLKDSNQKLVMHFGLTGTLYYAKKGDKPNYSFVRFIFGPDALSWISKRKFGGIWLVTDINTIKGLKNIGPDPLTLSEDRFLAIAKQHARKNIKSFLMDQDIISGIGNEYSDEILYQAGIDPHHKVSDLTELQKKKIYSVMNTVLDYAIKLRKKHAKDINGQDFFSGVESDHFKSSYLQAHRHGDGRCPKNKNHMLRKAKIAGRTTYYCPAEQK